MQKLIIPGELPGLNEIIDASKAHYQKYRRMKKDNTDLIKLKAQNKLEPIEKAYFDITYYRENRRYDPDNIAVGKKFILDGLVEAGILENDGWGEVAGWKENWKVDKENPRVEIKIKEV